MLALFDSWAQQSSQTGSSDRRISLRRFSSRKKVRNTRNEGRVKASADILEKRKQLFQAEQETLVDLNRTLEETQMLERTED